MQSCLPLKVLLGYLHCTRRQGQISGRSFSTSLFVYVSPDRSGTVLILFSPTGLRYWSRHLVVPGSYQFHGAALHGTMDHRFYLVSQVDVPHIVYNANAYPLQCSMRLGLRPCWK